MLAGGDRSYTGKRPVNVANAARKGAVDLSCAIRFKLVGYAKRSIDHDGAAAAAKEIVDAAACAFEGQPPGRGVQVELLPPAMFPSISNEPE